MHPPPCQGNPGARPVRWFATRLAAVIEARDRLAWAVRVRWLVIGGFFVLALVAHPAGLFVSIAPCAGAAVIGALMNGVNAWCVARGRWVSAVTAVAIPLDHLLITYVVIHTGGVYSPFIMMYFVQVLATAMLVDTVVAAASALLGMLTWSAGIALLVAGVVDAPPLYPAMKSAASTVYAATWAAYLLYSLGLLVYLGGYISDRLRASERDLADKNRRLGAALASLQEAHHELSRSYERLKQAETQLVQSEKMRGLGQLVAGIAHELNNPISFVSANVDLLRDAVDRLRQAFDLYGGIELPAEDRERLASHWRRLRVEEALADLPAALADCEEGARRTKRIVEELRAFSRSDERCAMRRADLHRGIESTLSLLAHRYRDRIHVHRDFSALPLIECQPDQINQVFLNLLANAADAIGARHGNVWISTRVRQDGEAGMPAASITIRDDGAGMSAEVRARIFEPFFTTKDVGQGTGLGLSVSYGIVQRHQGTLTVESEPGAGATFVVTLPVVPPSSHPAAQAAN